MIHKLGYLARVLVILQVPSGACMAECLQVCQYPQPRLGLRRGVAYFSEFLRS